MPIDRSGLKVSGLKEVSSSLRKFGDIEGIQELQAGLLGAAQVVAEEAKRRVPVRTGTARDAIRATSYGTKAYINGGKNSVPYYGWLDFGSREPVYGRPRSVGPWSKPAPAGPMNGRFIYPALDATKDEVLDIVEAAVWAVARREQLT